MKEAFGDDVDLKEEEILVGKKKKELSASIKIIIIVSILFLLILSITIIIFLNNDNLGKNDKNNKNNININNKKSEILCVYDIKENKNIQIIGDKFKNETYIDIVVNGKKTSFAKQLLFNITGNCEITYIIYGDELNMDYMFQNIDSLISIKMKSNESLFVTSMISTFENSQNLLDFQNDGFNLTKVESMSKLFYRSDLSDLKNLELSVDNLKDASYMMASTKISEISLVLNNSKKLEDISYLFYDNKHLKNINILELNPEKIKTISHLFDNCISLDSVDLNFLKTGEP